MEAVEHAHGRSSRKHVRDVGAGRSAAAAYLAAAAAPVLLWHDLLSDFAASFTFEAGYLLTAWTPWALLATGMLFLLPVVASAGRAPESRLYPRARNAYAGWGITLYMLGFVLALQVAEVAGSLD